MERVDYDAIAKQPSTTDAEIQLIWEVAAQFDKSLTVKASMMRKIASKRVESTPFTRSRLFAHMLDCEPILLSNLPIRLRPGTSPHSSLVEEIRFGLPQSVRACVRIEDSIRYLSVSSVVDKWMRADSVFGVADLHYIGTHFDARMDTAGLNDFNLLERGTEGFQSQDSLVVSAAGAVTDSHSDDHSGSNHSFVGAKIWLLWDTVEGLAHGIEDWERCDVHNRAAFDLSEFLKLHSSRWILISSGQTMFIPANLTHKVITLQPYLGLGSFHAALPGFVDLLKRWAQLPPLWASRSGRNRCSVEFITHRAIRKIESLRKASRRERFQWGVPYLKKRLQQADVRGDMRCHDFRSSADRSNFLAFVRAARRL